MPLTRRAVTASALAGFTALPTLLATPLAARAAAARHCLTVLYPWQPDAHFDFGYYRDKHLRTMSELYGKSLGGFEVRKGLRKGDGSPPAFIAIMTVQILSMDGFDAAGKEHLPQLIADLPNFSNVNPVGQIEELVN